MTRFPWPRLALCLAALTSSLSAQTSTPISPADLKLRLFALADDSMAGRATGSIGGFKAASYVAAEFRRLGLEPAGTEGYFQAIPFFRLRPDTRDSLSVDDRPLRLGLDFIPITSLARSPSVDGAEAVLGGEMADSATWISADAARGRLVLLRAPKEVGRAFFQRFGPLRRTTRFAQAAMVGIVGLDALGNEYRASLLEGRVVLDTTRTGSAPLFVLFTRSAAERILGRSVEGLSVGTMGRSIRGRADLAFDPMPYPVRNVVGILRGTDPARRETYVSVTAHSDHVGFDHAPVDHDSLRAFDRVVRPMGLDTPLRSPTETEGLEIKRILDSLRAVRPPRPDSIRNGADDDGSGTVGLLEIAEALTAGPRPARSILFVSHAAEEVGLLGSAWYTDHPTVPIDSIVAELDMDMIGRGGASDLPEGGPPYLEMIGMRRLSTEYGDILDRVNARQPIPFKFNLAYDVPGHPLQYYCRADHYSYARYGIPSVSLSRGEHLDYHQVTDEPQYIDYDALSRVARLVADAAVTLANLDHRPKLDQPKGDPKAPCVQ